MKYDIKTKPVRYGKHFFAEKVFRHDWNFKSLMRTLRSHEHCCAQWLQYSTYMRGLLWIWCTAHWAAYLATVQRWLCCSLQPRLLWRSSRWRTGRTRSPCAPSIPRSSHIWQRWPQCHPWSPRRCWGCRWRRESWGSAGHSCWSRCWSGSSLSS